MGFTVRDAERGGGSDGLAQSGRMVIILTTFPSPLKSQGKEGGRNVRSNRDHLPH